MKTTEQNAGWKPAPFIRLLIPLMAGILLERNFPVRPVFTIAVFCLSCILFVFCNHISFSRFFGMAWISGLAIQISFFSLGRVVMFSHRDTQIEQSSCFSNSTPNCLLLHILSDPVLKQNSYKAVAFVRWLTKGQVCFNENEKIFVYFSKKLDSRQLCTGSRIIIRKKLQSIENLKTFGDFDYKKYCRLKHIYAQVFLKENEFVHLQYEKESSVFSLLDSLRKKLVVIIKDHIPVKSGGSLLEALLVGYTDDLDPGLLKSYADTGVIHIIAISGLHLVLICHILQLGLKRVPRKKSVQWIKLVVIVCTLWAYSFISGSSPSVIRAATMFSLALLAKNITREAVLYNTLAASAFLLLCYDPFWIWDTGFQLSYAAVLSLGLFSKPVRELLILQNKILAAVWDAASVSIAAQILTTPISIYYFHRFPTYFLIANLVAVPLSSVILLGGILLCACSSFQAPAQVLGLLLGFLSGFLNEFVHFVSRLPGAVIGNLVITLPQLILVYFTILFFYCFLKLKKKQWLLLALCAVCFFQILNLMP